MGSNANEEPAIVIPHELRSVEVPRKGITRIALSLPGGQQIASVLVETHYTDGCVSTHVVRMTLSEAGVGVSAGKKR